MPGTYTEDEVRIRYLERVVLDMARDLESLKRKAGQAAQIGQMLPPASQANVIFNAITTSAVTARSGTTMGSGTFQFVDPTGAILVTLSSDGTFTGYNDNKAGWASGVYVKVYFYSNNADGGFWQFVNADGC